MLQYLRVFGLSALFIVFAIPTAALAQSTTTTSVNGVVTDVNNAPISGAVVRLRGSTTDQTTTDSAGKFAFANVAQGIYVLSVTKPGYAPAIQNDVTLLTGTPTTITVRMQTQTFSSLRTIASVTTSGRNALNTTPASVNVVNSQTFIDQAQPQVTRVLSQLPGVQVSFPSNSANAASPGSITVPNIRSATSYETASLIDGHPISVGQYGDNVTTFLNTFMFGSVEVVKGPGASAPEVNNAIGGTVNFRTKDPTATPLAEYELGIDNHGGSYTNFGFSDTVGKFGFVVDLATDNNPSALSGQQVYFDPTNGSIAGNSLNGNASNTQIGNTQSHLTTQYPLLACCYTLYGNLDQTAELFKLRYQISPAMRFTASYLSAQTVSDQNGNTSDFIASNFTPGAGYTGPLPAGPLMVSTVYPGGFSGEFNNEPIFQTELSSSIGSGSLLARYYDATISRYQYQGGSPNSQEFQHVALYGTSSGNNAINQTFNGDTADVAFNSFYREPELDKLKGGTLEYELPIMDNGMLTLSAEQTAAQTSDYQQFSGFNSFSIPPGTSQLLTTYLARGQFYLGRKTELTLANYFNTYSSTYAINCPMSFGFCTDASAQFGTGVTFQTTKNRHDDPRLGIVYHANPSTAIRFAAGSSIAPPFLGILSTILSPPVQGAPGEPAIESASNGNLKPETAFGYDLGMDTRLRDQSVVSADVYVTNLFNRFFGQTVDTGLTCAQVSTCTDGNGNAVTAPVPILNQTNTNISNAKFEGVEVSWNHTPTVGFGYQLSGALEKGYYYNLPPYFYCSTPGPGCTYNQNLNIINGQNTNGIPVGFYQISYNGNMRIPYSQGNANLSYTFPNSAYVMFGATYYGTNNSLNRPPFFIGYASLRYPVGKNLNLQLSGDNIFNQYPGFLPISGAGVPIDLANGTTAATTGNVLGPATWRLVLSSRM